MPKSVLHVLIPGLLDRAPQWSNDYRSFPRFAAIETIMAKSRPEIIQAYGVDATFCALFGLATGEDGDLPLGAVRRYGYGLDRDTGFWLCADPVHLSAGIAQVFLRDSDALNITQFDANQLGKLFTAHFAGQGWVLEVASPQHWHLRLPAAAAIKTFPQRRVMGKPIEAYLPLGTDAVCWRVALNEIQMLFHGAEINRDREQRGEAPINGLWLSGAGILPAAGSLHTDITAVWADDPVAVGLSQLANVETKPAPATLDSILHGGAGRSHLIFLGSLLAPASYDDLPAWSEALRELETAWFRPMAMALRTGRLAQCYIYDCAGRRFNVSRARRWLVWRRSKPLHMYDQTREDRPIIP